MFPGVDSRQMKAVMKKMGMSQVEIPARKVVIFTDEKELVINDPQVMKVIVMGEESLQITGTIEEKSLEPSISQDDINLVMEKAGCSEDEARSALDNSNGDIAEAIVSFKG